MIEDFLKQIAEEKRRQNLPDLLIRNYLKEYLQYVILEIIYSDKVYKNLIFTGGSCLRICFGLSRLSEDLDFNYLDDDFDLEKFAKFLKTSVESKMIDIAFSVKTQGNFRIYLKFSVLKELGLSKNSETDILLLKIEPTKNASSNFDLGLTPVAKFNTNFLIRRFELESLFCGKIAAVLNRVWIKGDVDIKGRDFYDLWWYLNKNVVPNWKRLNDLAGIKNLEELSAILTKKIDEVVTPQKLNYDLSALIDNQDFVQDFSKNYKDIVLPLLVDLKTKSL